MGVILIILLHHCWYWNYTSIARWVIQEKPKPPPTRKTPTCWACGSAALWTNQNAPESCKTKHLKNQCKYSIFMAVCIKGGSDFAVSLKAGFDLLFAPKGALMCSVLWACSCVWVRGCLGLLELVWNSLPQILVRGGLWLCSLDSIPCTGWGLGHTGPCHTGTWQETKKYFLS